MSKEYKQVIDRMCQAHNRIESINGDDKDYIDGLSTVLVKEIIEAQGLGKASLKILKELRHAKKEESKTSEMEQAIIELLS